MLDVIGEIFLLIGGGFLFLAALGLLRMPDVFNRIQAGTKAATLGALSLILGVAVQNPGWWPKLLILALFVMITSPVGSSTIARAALMAGIRPWRRVARKEDES